MAGQQQSRSILVESVPLAEAPQPLSLPLGASTLSSKDTYLAVLQLLASHDLGLQPRPEASVQRDLVGACRVSQEEVLNLAGAGNDKFSFKTNKDFYQKLPVYFWCLSLFQLQFYSLTRINQKTHNINHETLKK